MQTKIITLLHAYVQCVYIVSAKYQIAPLKAVVEVDFSRIFANKNYKLLHAYVQCVYIVSAKYQIAPSKYQIAPSKAVVGVDRPIKALSMHIQKPYKGIIV